MADLQTDYEYQGHHIHIDVAEAKNGRWNWYAWIDGKIEVVRGDVSGASSRDGAIQEAMGDAEYRVRGMKPGG